MGLKPTLGRSFETQVKDLQRRARDAALRPVPQAAGSTGPAPEARLQFSQRSGAGQAAYGTGGDELVSPFDTSATMPTNQRTLSQEEMARIQQALHEVLNAPVDINIQQELEKLRAADTTASMRKHIETTTFTSRKLIQGGGINFAFELRNGVPVIYKPAQFQSREKIRAGIEPSTQWRREIAASLVAEHLTISLIPPTARIENINGEGSAQLMKEGFLTGKKMSAILKDPFFDARKLVTDEIAEDWQLLEDLLLETDRHQSNYMIRVNDQNKVIELALIDNGLCLSANPGVLKKRHNGPREMHSIGLKNLQRLRHMISHQAEIERDLEPYLENAAVAGLFARAKALLMRGTYGNFVLEEINSHLPPNFKMSRQVYDYEINE
ncbi:hypothetical protein [Prosthecobacter dejongeii]|uniref:PI3K/PI4K catalytic domain-containing protein n=1 Tax=Prosthecobacter dejongeii TaxID=48465 RepID=A0A7W8DRP3_9BACT|nr:hypothetical protein [Prosthecobacter dejongeii]MBB5039500.1 hypothetical protein [Prosthecobacter dejongeii]